MRKALLNSVMRHAYNKIKSGKMSLEEFQKFQIALWEDRIEDAEKLLRR